MIRIIQNTKIDFLGKRRVAFAISFVLVLLGLVTLIQISRGQANLGIDFVGGTALQLKFDHPVRIDEARSLLAQSGFPDAELQEFVQDHKLLIRVKKETTIEDKIAGKIIESFKNGFSNNPFVVDSSTEIGPKIGKKLQKDAIVAVTFSLIGIILFITMRFEIRFGIAAAIATFHDVLAILGILYLADREITLLVVTALLTLAGYSLTDTVVVFDRIRENLRQRRRESLEKIINAGINQVLGRTIVTSLTTLLVVVTLFLFGGEVIHDFSLTLILGIVIGSYSSIFVASPLLLVWGGGQGTLLRRK